MTDTVEIDQKAKKTEAGWQDALDRFWLTATPKLFEWLGWVAALAALTYVQQKGHNLWLGIIIGICYGSLLLYFLAYFARFKFVGLPGLKGVRLQQIASIMISGLLAIATYLLVRYAVSTLSSTGP